eukprot:142966_1
MNYLIIFIILSNNEAIWTSRKAINTLPRPDHRMVAGYYNRTIYILGGVSDGRQSVEYRVDDATFHDEGVTALAMKVAVDNTGTSFYTQQQNTLYWIDFNVVNMITVYDLHNKQHSNFTLAQTVGSGSCLSQIHFPLFENFGADSTFSCMA